MYTIVGAVVVVVVGFTTAYAISVYPHYHSGVYSIQHYIYQRLVAARRFSPGTPVSSTNKTDRRVYLRTIFFQ